MDPLLFDETHVFGKAVPDVFSLAETLYLHSEEAARALRQGLLSPFLMAHDEEKAKAVERLRLRPLPNDVFVFEVQEVLNPYLSFRMKGLRFDDYPSLGAYMLSFSPSYDPVMMEMVRYGLLEEQMRLSGFAEKDPSLYGKVKALTLESGSKEYALSYFETGFLLSGEQGIPYQGVRYPDLYSFVYYLSRSGTPRSVLGKTLSHAAFLEAYSEYGKDRELVRQYFHLLKELEKSEQALSKKEEQEQDDSRLLPSAEEGS